MVLIVQAVPVIS